MSGLTALGITEANLEHILLLEGSGKAVFDRKVAVETAELQKKVNYLSMVCGTRRQGNVSELRISRAVCDLFRECGAEIYKGYSFNAPGLSIQNRFFSCEEPSFFVQQIYIRCKPFLRQENKYGTVQTVRINNENEIPLVEITGSKCPRKGVVDIEFRGDLPMLSQKISDEYERASKNQDIPCDSNLMAVLSNSFNCGRW
jgi:hypothetical protein